jgi:acylphosphatase
LADLYYIFLFGGMPTVADKEVEQREIYYSGRVQGVGFRYTARSLAAHRRVTGFVQNMPDGRVCMVVEGEKNEVQAFIDSIKAEMGAYIHNAQVALRPAAGRFKGFEIRF